MNQLNKYLSAILVSVTLLSVVGCASNTKQETVGAYVDDSVITTKVKAAILKDQGISVSEVNVETFKGMVQLSGFVSSHDVANKAIAAARSVNGVTSIKNDMRLK